MGAWLRNAAALMSVPQIRSPRDTSKQQHTDYARQHRDNKETTKRQQRDNNVNWRRDLYDEQGWEPRDDDEIIHRHQNAHEEPELTT